MDILKHRAQLQSCVKLNESLILLQQLTYAGLHVAALVSTAPSRKPCRGFQISSTMLHGESEVWMCSSWHQNSKVLLWLADHSPGADGASKDHPIGGGLCTPQALSDGVPVPVLACTGCPLRGPWGGHSPGRSAGSHAQPADFRGLRDQVARHR